MKFCAGLLLCQCGGQIPFTNKKLQVGRSGAVFSVRAVQELYVENRMCLASQENLCEGALRGKRSVFPPAVATNSGWRGVTSDRGLQETNRETHLASPRGQANRRESCWRASAARNGVNKDMMPWNLQALRRGFPSEVSKVTSWAGRGH